MRVIFISYRREKIPKGMPGGCSAISASVNRAVQIAQGTDGVKSVVNQLTVKGK
jgi:hypothetical protein